MKALILDDEAPALKILSHYATKIPFIDIVGTTTSVYEAMELVSKNKVDLLLTDIEMPDLSGVDLVRSLNPRPLVIFTTAYDEYALDGFELDVVDYLVKPIRFERFLKALHKAHKLFNLEKKNIENTPIEYLTVKVEYNNVNIRLDRINYIEGLKDYVKIHTIDHKVILTRLNLKGIFTKLPKEDFIRIHRSYIIAVSKISAYQKHRIQLGNVELPVGKAYNQQVLDRLVN